MRTLATLLLSAPLISAPLIAQSISIGLRAGLPVTPALAAGPPQRTSEPRFTMGPVVEIHVWHRLSLGADFLLRRTSLATSSAASKRATVWRAEAPLTVIYRFRIPTGPFIRTGVALNRVLDIGGAAACARGPFGERFYCLEDSPSLSFGTAAQPVSSWEAYGTPACVRT